jgi:chromosome segregation ATPase
MSEKRIEEIGRKIKLTEIEIDTKSRKRKRYEGNSLKENVHGIRERVMNQMNEVKSELKHEEFGKANAENVLNGLKDSLESKKKEIEMLRNQKVLRIPPQFLASEKLAMNKKKYSPKKTAILNVKTKRSSSASK